MNDFLHFIRATMVEPEAFGTVHLIAIAAVVLLVTLLCIFFASRIQRSTQGYS